MQKILQAEYVKFNYKFITERLFKEICIERASPVYLNYFLL